MMKLIKNTAIILLALGVVLLTSCTVQVQISDNGEGEPIFQTADDENSLKNVKIVFGQYDPGRKNRSDVYCLS